MFWLLLLVWAVLVAVFWGGSLWLQAYLYNEPASGMYWRAPAAATATTLCLAFWCYLESSSYDPAEGGPAYDVFIYAAASRTTYFPEFAATNLDPAGKEGKPIRYRTRDRTMVSPPYRKWSPTDLIIVKEDGNEVRFVAEKDGHGHYVRERKRAPAGLGWLISAGAEQPLRYKDGRGRIMTEDAVGQLTSSRWGRFWAVVLLSVAQFVVCFACLWLLIGFQWPHALLIAVVLWSVITFAFMHMLVTAVDSARSASALGALDRAVVV